MRLPARRRAVKLLAACLAAALLAGCSATPEELVADYLSDDPDVSGRAERDLLGLGGEALPALVDAFVAGESREKTGRLLARFEKPAVEPLAGLLGSDDPALAADAAWVLGQVGEAAVEPLIGALESGTGSPADLAAALGAIGGPAWAPMLALFDSTEDENLKGILAAAFFTSGDADLAETLRPRVGDPRFGDAFLSTVVAHTPPEALAGTVDAGTAWRILTFVPLEPLVGPISELVPELPPDVLDELTRTAAKRDRPSFERDLVRMHLAGVAGEWNEAASYGAGPFETLVVSYDAERENPLSADLLRVALLHHGGLYLKYLIDGAEALADSDFEQAQRLSALAGEVTRVIEELTGAARRSGP
ncbi:MAG TPA: hypothetical protein VM054_02805 [bacterium]|nr:hypothetical protein [bacterium]